MKRTILSICLLGLFLSLTAQDQAFHNSLSLNFAGAARNGGDVLPIQPPARLWVPGIEYRFDYSKQFTFRAGLDYQPLVRYGSRVAGSDNFFQRRIRGLNLSSGVQYRFWGDDFLKTFRMYAFGDLILGREWVENRINDQVSRVPLERHTESLLIHASLGLGLGMEYIFLERLVLRAEMAIMSGLHLSEEIDLLQNTTADFGFFPRNVEAGFVTRMPFPSNLFSELSIGWRF